MTTRTIARLWLAAEAVLVLAGAVAMLVLLGTLASASELTPLERARLEQLDPTPIRELEALRARNGLPPLADVPKHGHGGTEPPWNDPSLGGGCFDGSFEHETHVGAEWRLPPYYAQPFAYGFTNAVGSPQPVTDDCGATGNYANAGQLGMQCVFTLRVLGGTLEAEPLAQGFVFWASGWEPAWYTPDGWTMLDVGTIYATWWTGSSEWTALFSNGEWVGWERFYYNPTDPALVGVAVFHQGAIDHDGDGEPDELSDVWSVTFTNQ